MFSPTMARMDFEDVVCFVKFLIVYTTIQQKYVYVDGAWGLMKVNFKGGKSDMSLLRSLQREWHLTVLEDAAYARLEVQPLCREMRGWLRFMMNMKTMWTFHVPILWILMLNGVNVYNFYYTRREICRHKSPECQSSWHLDSEVIFICIPSEHNIFVWFICMFPTIPLDLRMHKGDYCWITSLCRATYVRNVQELSKSKVYCLLIVQKALWKQISNFRL